MAIRPSRKKQSEVSATPLALSCHRSSNLASFRSRSSSDRRSRQRPSLASHSLPKWYLWTTSETLLSASSLAACSTLTKPGEGNSPARSSATRPYSLQRELNSASSIASLTNFPLNSSVCTSWAYILSWFATLSACKGRAVTNSSNTFSRNSCVALRKASESSSSDAWSSVPQSDTLCVALGTTCKWWPKSCRICSRASSPGASKKLSSCDLTSAPLASS
mmetsp:Transcript_96968/g.257661  ORF Transcript_96968/g.257661 Transcript_96968/m.257661 type:complete len:220 (+) Transcript_96968:1078-1737(+)